MSLWSKKKPEPAPEPEPPPVEAYPGTCPLCKWCKGMTDNGFGLYEFWVRGSCHKHPPQITVGAFGGCGGSRFPEVDLCGWCGEWEEKP